MPYIPYTSGTLGGRVQKLCESRGGRPGLSVLTSLPVSVDVKRHWTMLRHSVNMSTEIRGHEALHHHQHSATQMCTGTGVHRSSMAVDGGSRKPTLGVLPRCCLGLPQFRRTPERQSSSSKAGDWRSAMQMMMMMMSWCLMSSDVRWHIRDKLWPMPKHGSINLYVHGNQKAR